MILVRNLKMNYEGRHDHTHGDEEDLSNEEYERQRKHEEDTADEWKGYR